MTFADRIARLEAGASDRSPILNLSHLSDEDLRLLAAIPTIGPVDLATLPPETRRVLSGLAVTQ